MDSLSTFLLMTELACRVIHLWSDDSVRSRCCRSPRVDGIVDRRDDLHRIHRRHRQRRPWSYGLDGT